MYLSDRQRVEIALPAHAMMGILFAGADERDADFIEAVSLLRDAAREATGDLSDHAARKVLERVRRAHQALIHPYAGEGEDVAKVGLIVFYWIKALVETGYFTFAEGSAIDRALALYVGAIEHKAEIVQVNVSAQKQARRVIRVLQEQGYYRGLEVS